MNWDTLADHYRGKTVLVTGHTGFKGAWLSHMLLRAGAKVIGVSLPPESADGMFVRTGLQELLEHHEFDIRDHARLTALVDEVRPDMVFHLAAQPLVRRSYDQPVYTIETNVIGTANVLEAVRQTPEVRAVVVVTTDKVYENKEWYYGYRENDPLGGYDPYSGSKAAADIITQAYMRSFFNPDAYGTKHRTLVATVRAGNVIGGGDWSADRLIPDIIRSVLHGDGTVTLRNPDAVRPWEHVLEPLTGYLMLGKRLAEGEKACSGAWNFGPNHSSWVPVGTVTERLLALLGRGTMQVESDHSKHEAALLMLDITKARHLLGWRPRWSIGRTLIETVRWYAYVHERPDDARRFTEGQIAAYFDR